jgi:hypothetical protein
MMAADHAGWREQETGRADGCTKIARGIGCKIRIIEPRSPPKTPAHAHPARSSDQFNQGGGRD